MKKFLLLSLILTFLLLLCVDCLTIYKHRYSIEADNNRYIFDCQLMELRSGMELGELPMTVIFEKIKRVHSKIEISGAVYYNDSIKIPLVGIYCTSSPLTSGPRILPISFSDISGNFKFTIDQEIYDIIIFTDPGMECKVFKIVPKD